MTLLKVPRAVTDPHHMRRSRPLDDRGGIVVGWLLKLVVVLALIGILAYDLVSVAYTKVMTSDDARYIALGASEAIILQRADADEAIAVAADRAESRGVVLADDDIVVAKNGSVTVHVERTPHTLVTHYVGPLEPVIHAEETYVTPALR